MTDGIGADGWLSAVAQCPSPHFASRDAETPPTLAVIHAISLPPRQFGGGHVRALFAGTLAADAHPYFAGIAGLRVSAHFFVERSGATTQFVSCNDAAWHAGVSAWRGREACNGFSIGIELEGCDELPFTSAQYAAVNLLLTHLHRRYPTMTDVAGHSDIAPGRKTDPGPCFDWARLTAKVAMK